MNNIYEKNKKVVLTGLSLCDILKMFKILN